MSQYEKIRETLRRPLPGENAHLDMSPTGRGRSSEALKKVKKYKDSAVAIHIFDPANPKVLLMQRPAYPGTHGGQISFPGGKVEDQDQDLLETARRESEEEVGISKEVGEVLGQLTEIFIPVSGFRVVPYLILHEEDHPRLILEEKEVESIFFLPLGKLMQEELKQKVKIDLANGLQLPNIPAFVYKGKVIWGATAIILNELKQMLREVSF